MRSEIQGDREVFVADNMDGLEGMTILHVEDFKPGVRRVRCAKGNEFFTVYVRTETGMNEILRSEGL